MGDATALEAKGDRALRPGLFRWSKDYVTAAVYYGEAAELYKGSGDFARAAAVFEKLVDANRHLKDSWATGRAYEGLIECRFLRGQQTLDVRKTLELCDAAASSFALAGSLNSFLTLMDRLAK